MTFILEFHVFRRFGMEAKGDGIYLTLWFVTIAAMAYDMQKMLDMERKNYAAKVLPAMLADVLSGKAILAEGGNMKEATANAMKQMSTERIRELVKGAPPADPECDCPACSLQKELARREKEAANGEAS